MTIEVEPRMRAPASRSAGLWHGSPGERKRLDRPILGQNRAMFHLDRHTAEILEGARIVEVRDSGTLIVEKDGETTAVAITAYQYPNGEVVVELETTVPRHKRRASLTRT